MQSCHLIDASALTDETGNSKIVFFVLKCCINEVVNVLRKRA